MKLMFNIIAVLLLIPIVYSISIGVNQITFPYHDGIEVDKTRELYIHMDTNGTTDGWFGNGNGIDVVDNGTDKWLRFTGNSNEYYQKCHVTNFTTGNITMLYYKQKVNNTGGNEGFVGGQSVESQSYSDAFWFLKTANYWSAYTTEEIIPVPGESAAAGDLFEHLMVYNHSDGNYAEFVYNGTAWHRGIASVVQRGNAVPTDCVRAFPSGYPVEIIEFFWLDVSDGNYSFPEAPDAEVDSLEVVFTNRDKSIRENLSLDEREIFYPNANHSYFNGSPITDSTCNFTSYNISGYFDAMGGNFTLNGTEQNTHFIIDEGFSGLFYDEYTIRVCRENLRTPLEIYLNSTLVDTIDQDIIPPCSAGYHEEISITYLVNESRNFNFSVQCPGCNNANKQLTLVSIDDAYLIYDRFFEVKDSDLTFNASTNLYEYTSHLYLFNSEMSTNITVRCDELTQTESLEIGDVAPSVSVLAINNYTFSEGIDIETASNYSIIMDASGDIIVNRTFNLTFNNGTLIRSNIDNETIFVQNSEMFGSGIYNLSIYVRDDDGTVTTLETYFNLNDTVFPSAVWNSPENGSEMEVGSVDWSVSCNDWNLFAYNVTFFTPNGTHYASYNNEVDPPTVNVQGTDTFSIEGLWTGSLLCVDDHTKQEIEDYAVKLEPNKITFDGNISITGVGATDTHTVKDFDRYSFEFTYPSKTKEDKVYYLESDCKLKRITDGRYKAHFVDWCDRKWIDFEGIDGKPEILKNSDYRYTIRFKDVGSDYISFKSIGGINQYYSNITFNMTPDVTPSQIGYNLSHISHANWFNTDGLNTNSLSGVMLYMFLLLIIVFVIVLHIATKVPLFGVAAGFMLIFYSFLIFATVSVIFGIFLFLVGFIYSLTSYYLSGLPT